ncbi:hypothetical protein SGGMMB4_00718 [Sodalis glossinidius str. 'morsitans']|uniref:Uncharacterized protein n=1 Tax=Sodalis glossinidius (strain morsitans) TaxID=343509 RepID=A0A193QFJ2_SODGM|nr:hypothetical protein SGGMMB4_00718 [Sodalis glossinidius str. 'morsitans']
MLDGNYHRSRDIKWRQVHLIIWLDYSLARTLRQAIGRDWHQQEIWPGTGNRESFRRYFFSRESVLLWTLKQHTPQPRLQFPDFQADRSRRDAKLAGGGGHTQMTGGGPQQPGGAVGGTGRGAVLCLRRRLRPSFCRHGPQSAAHRLRPGQRLGAGAATAIVTCRPAVDPTVSAWNYLGGYRRPGAVVYRAGTLNLMLMTFLIPVSANLMRGVGAARAATGNGAGGYGHHPASPGYHRWPAGKATFSPRRVTRLRPERAWRGARGTGTASVVL